MKVHPVRFYAEIGTDTTGNVVDSELADAVYAADRGAHRFVKITEGTVNRKAYLV